ncbi:MAG: hypothetical protein KJ587_06570 [Alphaproteobacteria bacterium]|nr:hypothetical protein [Alphaproteobacteria bacterium]
MKDLTYELPVAPWPHTELTGDGGLHVTGKYNPPARLGAAAGGVIAIFFLVLTLGVWLDNEAIAVPALGWTLALSPVTFLIFAAMFRRNLDIKIYKDRIVLPKTFGSRNFSRQMPIEFRVEHHSRAATETGRFMTYRNALEVVMQYGENRIAIAEMPYRDLERAKALVIRLQNISDRIDAATQIMESRELVVQGGGGPFGSSPDIG